MLNVHLPNTPRTWVSGELVTDSIMNLHVRDQFSAIANASEAPVVQTETATYTLLTSDDVVVFTTAGCDLDLPAASTAGTKTFVVINAASSGVVTIDPDGAELINGLSSMSLYPGGRVVIFSTGTAWYSISVNVGTHELFIPAAALRPAATGGSGSLADITTSGSRYFAGLPFDATSVEAAHVSIGLPKSWNRGTVTAQFFWVNTAGGTGTVVWGLSGNSAGDAETLDAAAGTEQTVSDDAQSAQVLAVSAETAAVTLAGTPAAGDLTRLVIRRVATSDTYASDAYLLGVKLRLVVEAETDD